MESRGSDYNSDRGGATLAHEVAHNYNGFGDRWKHVNCGSPSDLNPNYPYNPCQIGSVGEANYYGYDVSAHAPTVQIVSPNGGETVDGPLAVQWTAEDADGGPLYYMVQYSADGGQNWETLASMHTTTSFTLADVSGLRGGEAMAVGDVLVTGGAVDPEEGKKFDFSQKSNFFTPIIDLEAKKFDFSQKSNFFTDRLLRRPSGG